MAGGTGTPRAGRHGPGTGGRAGVAVPVRAQVRTGTADLVPDPGRPGGWSLLVDGVDQSYVDLADPGYLRYPYVRWFAAVAALAAPAGGPLAVLHLGGGALCLPRYLATVRPGSRQRVIEHDGELVDLVRRVLPLPRGAGVRVRVDDARQAVAASPPARYDLVVCDVFSAARMPAGVATVEFAELVRRVLRPGGRYVVNLADAPPLSATRVHAATLRHAFPQVCLLAAAGMLRGRRYGNVVLAAGTAAGVLDPPRLARLVAAGDPPAQLLAGAELDRFVAGARPARDEPVPAGPGDGPADRVAAGGNRSWPGSVRST